jgi:hypothetical protein
MKSAILILFYSLLSGTLFAQDTNLVNINHSADAFTAVKLPLLSAVPTSKELSTLFWATGSQLDSKIAIQMAAAKGDGAIPGLAQLLVGNSGLIGATSVSASDTLIPTKLYALSTLELIGSPAAISVILQSLASEKSPVIRAYGLNAVSKTYYKKVQAENLTPVQEIITALFQNVDDQTYIGDFQKSVGQIAYEGLMCWIGLDFGDPQFADARMQAGGAQGSFSPAVYRKLWWNQNAGKLAWNGATGHFEVAVN